MRPRTTLRAELRYLVTILFGAVAIAGPLALALAIGERVRLTDLATFAIFVLLFLLAAAVVVAVWIVMERDVELGERARVARVVPFAMLFAVVAALDREFATGAARFGRGRIVAIALVAGAMALAIAALRKRRSPPLL